MGSRWAAVTAEVWPMQTLNAGSMQVLHALLSCMCRQHISDACILCKHTQHTRIARAGIEIGRLLEWRASKYVVLALVPLRRLMLLLLYRLSRLVPTPSQ